MDQIIEREDADKARRVGEEVGNDMKPRVKKVIEEIGALIDEVEGDTRKYSRAEAIEFCEEIEGMVRGRIEAMKEDDGRDNAET